MDVLPNGALIVQAARNMFVGNERQTIIVRGILRPDDISPTNIATSSSLTNLEVEVKGKGVVSDGARPPNAIIRAILNVPEFLMKQMTSITRQLASLLLISMTMLLFASAARATDEQPAHLVRLKDISTIEGVRDNPLIGYGSGGRFERHGR